MKHLSNLIDKILKNLIKSIKNNYLRIKLFYHIEHQYGHSKVINESCKNFN